jgi:hypothetical protein
MECLRELIGLRGGCEDISSNAETYLDTKVTHDELSDYVDQNVDQSVSDLFTKIRTEAADELVSQVNEHMADSYIHKTLIDAQQVGDEGTTLVASAAAANLKGVRFEQCSRYPYLAYRVTKLGFVGTYTGNVTVTYYDGVTGQSLGTDTIAAISGQRVETRVNRLFRVKVLLALFDATAVGGYRTRIGYMDGCYSCGINYQVNRYSYARGVTATIGTPTDITYVNDLGGLYLDAGLECDTQTWICGVKAQLSRPMLWKSAELAMEYALFNTSRGNTRTIRDRETLENRQMMYRENFDSAMKRALKAIVLPNDQLCFRCQRTNRIAVQIP